jgi:hypothetical protein
MISKAVFQSYRFNSLENFGRFFWKKKFREIFRWFYEEAGGDVGWDADETSIRIFEGKGVQKEQRPTAMSSGKYNTKTGKTTHIQYALAALQHNNSNYTTTSLSSLWSLSWRKSDFLQSPLGRTASKDEAKEGWEKAYQRQQPKEGVRCSCSKIVQKFVSKVQDVKVM